MADLRDTLAAPLPEPAIPPPTRGFTIPNVAKAVIISQWDGGRFRFATRGEG